jgi:cysteinyl-tRNA synthetase
MVHHAVNAITKNKLTPNLPELFVLFHRLDTRMFKIGLLQAQEEIAIPHKIKSIAQARRDAKLAKDYARADVLREELQALGWDMLDGKQGFEIVVYK